jgi:Secretion system C-terminal sorting domain
MKLFVLLLMVLASGVSATAQSLEWTDRQENFQAGLGQTVRIPIRIKNTSDKAQFFVIKKAQGDLGSNQKGFFCLGEECFDPSVDQFSKKIEAGETLSTLYFTVETGLVTTLNSFRFEVFPRGNPTMGIEHSVSLSVDEKPTKSLVFQSRDITIHDVYPNPVSDQATIDYRIHNELIKAKVVIHNILGSPVGHYDLHVFESKVKIQADEFTSGVYFYTVYLDNIGVLTRKLVVRK